MMQYLAGMNKVLRFYGQWDDSQSLFGDVHELVVHYYLCNDTLEIKELFGANSGRDPSTFLARIKVPGPGNTTGSWWQEITLPMTVPVFGKNVQLYACDGFTKRWYQSSLGVTLEDAGKAVPDDPMASAGPPLVVPPQHKVYGELEEDTLMNCLHIAGKIPRKIDKSQGRIPYGAALRFEAMMDGASIENADRRFIVQYFLADGTISVFEPPMRNSGITGGMFKKRERVRNPAREGISAVGLTQGDTNYAETVLLDRIEQQYYTGNEFYVGAKLWISGRTLRLFKCDVFTLNYMDSNPAEYPMSDANTALDQLKDEVDVAALAEQLGPECDVVALKVCAANAGCRLTDHQYISIVRQFGSSDSGTMSTAVILG